MAAIAPTRTSTIIPCPEDPSAEYKWVYCCGAHATEQTATGEAKMLSGEKEPGLVFYHDTKISDIIRSDDVEVQRVARLVNQLVDAIKPLISIPFDYRGLTSKTRRSITLLGHSFGAVFIRDALLRLNEEERRAISVTTFGGSVMIPNALARTVRNYIDPKDLIAKNVNTRLDPTNVLGRMQKIYHKGQELARERGVILNTHIKRALLEVFARDTYDQLDPCTTTQAENAELFGKIFILGQKEGVNRKWIQEGLEKWVDLFKNYNLFTLTDGQPIRKTPFASEETWVVDQDLIEGALDAMIRLGQSSLTYHGGAAMFWTKGAEDPLFSKKGD